MRGLSVYLAHPISGLTFGEVVQYYNDHTQMLRDLGYVVYDPVTMYSEHINVNEKCAPQGLQGPLINDHALFERDKWMVSKVDVVLADLRGAKKASIGATMEMAWGALLGKHVIVIMEKTNPMYHGFVLEAADVVFESFDEAISYMRNINK